MPQRAAPAATQQRPAPKSHTTAFRCVDCGHDFRRRTKAGIHSTCPKCHGQAVGSGLYDRMVAASAKKVEQRQESKKRRSTATTPAKPSPPSQRAGEPSSSPRRAPARIEPGPKPRPSARAVSPPGAQPPTSGSPASGATPAVAKSGGPGFWSRLLGHDDGD